MSVLSPITHEPAKLLEHIPTSLIIDQYKKDVDMDVSRFYQGVTNIQLYECEQTGYRFFHPFGIDGDANFYEELQKFPWYYADWKWDYDAAIPHIEKGSKVLDIGCGYGSFLNHIKNTRQCDCTGLEFNDKAVETGRAKGLNIEKESIESYATLHAETYDAVCSFQVLEHITRIDEFMTASIKALKKGGKLLVCVPNNNPYFLQHEKYQSMNMPPHHMGWWNKETFKALTNVYPLKLDLINEQSLERYRYFTKLSIKKISKGNSLLKMTLSLFTPAFIAYFLINRTNVKAGHILAVYTKV